MSAFDPNVILMGAFLVLPQLVLLAWMWVGFRRRCPEHRLQFRITDIWAFMLGFSVGLFVFSLMETEQHQAVAGTALLGQCVGGFCFYLHNQEASGRPTVQRGRLMDGFVIFLGTMLGLFLPFMGVILLLCILVEPSSLVGLLSEAFSGTNNPTDHKEPPHDTES